MKISNSENSPKENEWFSHFQKLHCEHQLHKEQEELTKILKQKETRDLPGGKRIHIINMRAQHITFNKAIKRPVASRI